MKVVREIHIGASDKLSENVKNKNNSPLHCVKDFSPLVKIGEKKSYSYIVGKMISFPIYECPKCGKNYTSSNMYKDYVNVRIGDKEYKNILPSKDMKRYLKNPKAPEQGSQCYVYGTKKIKSCLKCNKGLSTRAILFKSKNNKDASCQVKYCASCDIYYMHFTVFDLHSNSWILLNADELPKLKNEYYKKMETILEHKNESELQIKKREIEQETDISKEQRLTEERNRLMYNKTGIEEGKEVVEHLNGHSNNIQYTDFVVRRATFKCMYQNHQLKNIDATVEIINGNGEIEQTKVSAGYCPNCNVFFIMESTFQDLKRRGTPVCRISDEKSYLKNNCFVNGVKLAQESILMQYGYNVSQEEGLSDTRRRKILALLVDNKILTRSDIISYLDFFINQRKYQHKFEKAIEKWESDREFISKYQIGTYTQYSIHGIHRKN